MIKIVTDSTCDLPQEIVAQHGITVVPLHIQVGNQSYRDGVDLSRDQFYAGLPGYASVPKTAAPAPGVFTQIYERLAAEGASEILSIHIAPSLSGVIDVARLGAREVRSASVTVFDSGQLSMGVGFAVVKAAEAVAAGRSKEEILALLEDQVPRTSVFAITDTFEFLRRSGRVTVLQYHVGSLLRIQPFLKMFRGEATSGIVRSYRVGLRKLTRLAEGLAPLERLSVLHASARDQAQALWRRVQHLKPRDHPVLFARVNPSIGTHVGPGCVGLACVAAPHP
jgi:DegV family protein with EDD domain